MTAEELTAEELVAELVRRKIIVAVAESCTGGQLAAAITSVPGSSAVFDRGFITYSNAAKTEMLGVPAALITQCGAVSRDVAIAMADGALRHSNADIALSITGVAGPSGGTVEKPVGRVHFALATKNHATHHSEERFGMLSRSEIQSSAVSKALAMIKQQLLD
jgi:nicotinamide-nucleotide amidase